ncbi:Salicylate hydroxylase [Leucoagaricus sp. SymC.cos]|nr:Salicylate hydroxylase [Leucoagaricus sp. SymC.cos]
MSRPSPQRTRVAIVGAGIVGLILAVALNQFDEDQKIEIDLYEAAPELSEIGAGINIWPRTWQIFQELGLGEVLIPHFDHVPDLEPRPIYEVRKADQKDGFKVMDLVTKGGALRIHRADFQRCLIQHLPLHNSKIIPINSRCTLHLSHRLIDYNDPPPSPSNSFSSPVILYFENRCSTTCDILIGADGIKSTIRRLFLQRMDDPRKYERFIDPTWSGAVAYRGLIAREELGKVFPGHRAFDHPGIMYMGKNRHCVVYSVSGGKFINVVAAVHDLSKEGALWEGPWNVEITQQELREVFNGWEDEFQALVECIKRPTRWAIQNMHHLDTFARGRVFLIGDAAHAMVPYLGAGAGVGIDDAYILASLLTSTSMHRSPTPELMNNLVETYNTVCVPHANGMSKASFDQGHLYTLQTPQFHAYKEGDNVPMKMLLDVFQTAEKGWWWAVTDPREERRRAVGSLQNLKVRL